MRRLEVIDARDRNDGTPRMKRLRQIPPATGRLLAILAASAPAGPIIEIGTSAGYSTLWLSLAATVRRCALITFEILPEKVRLARETFQLAEVDNLIEVIEGDAVKNMSEIDNIAFCFLDAEKEHYDRCYDLVIPKLVPGGIFVADNVISHAADLQPLVDRSLADPRVDSVIVPIGKGELLCRKC